MYFLAMDMTRRRFASIISFFAWRAYALALVHLCVPKIKFDHIGGGVEREPVVEMMAPRL